MDANVSTTTQYSLEAPLPDGPESSSEKSLPGYHLRSIPKGEFGEPSKIAEETEEFLEALEQGNELMALIELSDLLGAVQGYLERHHPSITINSLLKLSEATQRAFKNGHR